MKRSQILYAVPPPSLIRGLFKDRPNRFLLRCLVDGRMVEAFLPNPGRLEAILLPDTPLYLSRQEPSPHRKTEYTVWGAAYRGSPVLLHTHFANRAAEWLLRSRRVPGLEDWEVARTEVAVGHSRFDFLLERGGETLFLEVKSTSQFREKMAMFPDSPTLRGKKHVLELAALKEKGYRAAVLFLVHSRTPRFFLPSWHLDPEFAAALYDHRFNIGIFPVGIQWGEGLQLEDGALPLALPWEIYERERGDRGNYLLFSGRGEKEWQVACGYADPLDSFLRKAKRGRIPVSSAPLSAWNSLPIRSSRNEEKFIREQIRLLPGAQNMDGGGGVYSFPLHPKKNREFCDLVLSLRTDRLLLPGN